ncbi:hypothetical protein [Streptomyces blattellae]|uniref:hypothetical protein n=1 Tax=Streptomyces blattellae TaxID=2569855 RepID=UPI0012B736BB|nr:hypothetical protein [Streptomyces blattellae]
MADRYPSRRISCAVLSLAVLLLTACSGETKPEVEYALPDSFCGVQIGKEVIKPFFPPGSKLTKSETGGDLVSGKYSSGCDYLVDDGAPTLMVSTFFHEDVQTARQIAEGRAQRFGDGDTRITVAASGDAASYSRGAVAVAECPGYPSDTDDLPRESFSVEIVAYYPKDLSKQGEALTQLVRKIVPIVSKANNC